jgi:hypothetical protein
MEVIMTLFRRPAGKVIMPAFDKPGRLSPQVAALRMPASRGDSTSVETGACRGAGWLSFRRIADIPFDACVAALEGLLREGSHGEIHIGQSRLRGPIKRDRGSGTCGVQVRLARGPLRPVLRMRLQADHWSSSPPQTALELIPCGRVRPSAAYFRAGHRLLDQLATSLARPVLAQRPDCTAQHQPTAAREHDIAQSTDFHQDLKLPAEAITQIADDTRSHLPAQDPGQTAR